jgi:hypothetical protein
MAEHGYRLIDITELNRSPKHNVLWLSKLAFLRNASRLLAHATSYEQKRKELPKKFASY